MNKGLAKIWKNIIFFLIMISFFLVIIVLYYNNLTRKTIENIVDNCEYNSVSSSEKINKYLATGNDCIAITAYNLDAMLRQGKSTQDILEYLQTQTVAVDNIVPEETTGVYGYINEEYLDGIGWVPDEDYVPTERPWYIQAMADEGQLVTLDPYVDAMTGEVTTTMAKELSDGKSVVAVDMSLRELQSIVEDISGEDEKVMVLSCDYMVICHPDSSEVGVNYLEQDGSLGNAVVKAYNGTEDDSFKVDYDGTEYIVYAAYLDNGWICMSVTDTTKPYMSLRLPLILTIIVSVVFVAFLLVTMILSSRQEIKAAELERTSLNAVAANQAKSQFLANMSHEIRTPINAILGMNEMVIRESKDADILPYARNVRTSGRTLLGIVNDILDFSKIESGKIEIIPINYDLSSLIVDLAVMIESRADEKGLELIYDIDPNMPKHLFGDEIRIKQVITNLLTNAVKYTPDGSVTFHMGYEDDEVDENCILLKVSVKDTGMGIHPEDIDKLFSKFERLDEENNRNIEGTGLGLNITKNLIELMGSSLSVESEYGLGSEFSFSLKQQVTDRIPLGEIDLKNFTPSEEEKDRRESFIAPTARILVVDDNEMNLTVFKSLVKRTMAQVDTANSGDEGIKLSLSGRYDIIFMDHMMPVKDGIETLHEIRENEDNPNITAPIICLTANAISGARDEYINAGFDDYLTKPIDSEKLEDMMLRLLPEDKVELEEDAGVKEKVGTEEYDGVKGEQTSTDMSDKVKELIKVRIDVNEGLKNSGTMDSYMELLKIFYESLEFKKNEIHELYENKKFKDYTIKVHAMKSSARIIGAAFLGEEAQALEDAGKREDFEYISVHHDDFIEELEVLKEPLASIFEDGSISTDDHGSPQVEASAEIIADAYEEIKQAAIDMDCDRLEEIIESMNEYRIPDSEEQLWNKVCEAIKQFDYETVEELL